MYNQFSEEWSYKNVLTWCTFFAPMIWGPPSRDVFKATTCTVFSSTYCFLEICTACTVLRLFVLLKNSTFFCLFLVKNHYKTKKRASHQPLARSNLDLPLHFLTKSLFSRFRDYLGAYLSIRKNFFHCSIFSAFLDILWLKNGT